ncbi:MAG: efflux RND transporter periplasmic adaptor subunit [Ignavibacteriaceae bacterium]|nr:efflux RND transporter periplasmic adaptor subunit [Ignavibacteriaceae bacterium]
MSNKVELFNRHWLVVPIIVFLTFLVTNCGDQNSAGGQFSMPPMPVEVTEVKKQGVNEKFEAVGTIEAIEEITVVSEINASVVDIPFKEGSHIMKGELIAQLDDSQLAAEVARAEALYSQSLATYNRVKKVVDQNAGTPQDLDDALASLKVAEANLKLAEAALSKTRIVAPFSGMIGSRQVSVGSFLRTGDAITELANLNEIRINFSAPERFLSELKRGSEVIVYSPVYPGHEVKGIILAIEPIIDSDTRTVRIVARVQNPGQKFRPGMSANVSVILSKRPDALTIPTEAVFANGNQSFVYILNADSTVAPAPVTLGMQLSDVVEIVDGLQEGMNIITAGHQKLFPGAKVMPVNSQAQQQQ